jgi:hypothetical protein
MGQEDGGVWWGTLPRVRHGVVAVLFTRLIRVLLLDCMPREMAMTFDSFNDAFVDSLAHSFDLSIDHSIDHSFDYSPASIRIFAMHWRQSIECIPGRLGSGRLGL